MTYANCFIEDIADAWGEIEVGDAVVHEVHCVVEGDRRVPASQRRSEIRFESLTKDQLADIRQKLEHWAQNLAKGARSRNTVDALRRDVRLFCDWCRNTARVPLPASQETLTSFLQAFSTTRKVSTLRRYLASIATLHSVAGLSNPTTGELVKSELDLVARNQAASDKAARAKGEPVRFAKRQAAPLREEHLQKADALFGDSLLGLRDRAIVWMAFDTLARASELAACRVEDIRDAPGGAKILTIHHSKSDQYGEGMTRYVSPFTAERLEAWLKAAKIENGYIFRGIKGGQIRKNQTKAPMLRDSASRQLIYRSIKKCATRLYAEGLAQFDISAYSAHSTRVGAAQDMLVEGVSMLAVQQAGGWKTDVMPQQYAKEIDALQGGSAQLAKKRGRAAKPNGPAKQGIDENGDHE